MLLSAKVTACCKDLEPNHRLGDLLTLCYLMTYPGWAADVGILKGHRARGEVLTFVALPRDKWIGANAWGISKYMS